VLALYLSLPLSYLLSVISSFFQLGFGTIWVDKGLANSTTPPCNYAGSKATEKWQALSGCTTSIPLEQGDGEGSECGHWAEGVFNNEILSTGGDADASIEEPVSRLTIAGMEDLGYTVDYGKAEPYTLADNQKCRRRLDGTNPFTTNKPKRTLSDAHQKARDDAITYAKEKLGLSGRANGRAPSNVLVVFYKNPDTGKRVDMIIRG